MEPPSPHRILILDDSGRRSSHTRLEATLLGALSALDFPSGELSVRLTSDEEIRNLNRTFRGKDEATDVLSFPAAEIPVSPGDSAPLGDIAISVPRAERQAASRGISLDDEVAYLGLHGTLHLSGLDDETDEQRVAMLAEMERLGRQLGLAPVSDWHTIALEAGGSR
jgi:rRNA maturation RNase YbeY